MKRKSFFLWSLLAAALTVTSCSSDEVKPNEEGEGTLKFSVTFSGNNGSARANRPVPPTSWSNVNSLQFFLYKQDASKQIVFSDVIENPGALPHQDGDPMKPKEITRTVPEGNYTLAIVANAKPTVSVPSTIINPIVNYFQTTEMEWTAASVYNKKMTDLSLSYKANALPQFAIDNLTVGHNGFEAPSEIFVVYEDVAITKGNTYTTGALKLKREVSLARVRINYDVGNGTDNTPTGANGVNYDKNSGLFISVLPENMKVGKGADGGASNTSKEENTIHISNPSGNVFFATDPSYGTGIVDANYKLWREVVLFPNSIDRGTTAADAGADREYFIVVSAQGKTGHVLSNGTPLPAPATIYWGAKVRGALLPNTVSEINLKLTTGGQTDFPEPQDEGILIIHLDSPEPWDANVQEETHNV